ncbi:hypothetical protein [Hydrococcus rivularis]|uniref:hypothetical protein n=1 Tax=Hydrococcus rivularis TaxID=1616834 RepID=UPI0015882231|nr:hypothetical protein [Hydrococcus rivularis]
MFEEIKVKRSDFQQKQLEVLKKIDNLISLGEQNLEEIDKEMSKIEKELKQKVEQPSQ